MHFSCLESFLKSVKSKHTSQPTRNHPESIQMKEYLCPLCKSLSNMLLPIHFDGIQETTMKSNEPLRNMDEVNTTMCKDIPDTKAMYDSAHQRISSSIEKLLARDIIPGAYNSSQERFEAGYQKYYQRYISPLSISIAAIQLKSSKRSLTTTIPSIISRDLFASTIASLEISSRGVTCNTIIDAISHQNLAILRVLSKVTSVYSTMSLNILEKKQSVDIQKVLGLLFKPTAFHFTTDPFALLVDWIILVHPGSEFELESVYDYVQFFCIHAILKTIVAIIESVCVSESNSTWFNDTFILERMTSMNKESVKSLD